MSAKSSSSFTAKDYLEAGKYQDAADKLTAKGSPEKLSPADRADLALAWTYIQKEEDAAKLIKDLPFEGHPAHENLARYFASRQQIVKKLSLPDPEGAKWADHYRLHQAFKPECKLSIAMIVKNEAKHIKRCISSVRDLADEIVIFDTGSTDDTLQIAKKAAGKTPVIVGHFDWINDFSAARNHSLSLATGDWALVVDADEELLAGGEGEIRQGLIRPYFGGFHIRIANYTGEEGDESTYVHVPMRLFRLLPTTKFTGRIHEQVTPSIMEAGYPTGALKTATLLHYGYRPSEMVEKNKKERFISMLEREVRENPLDAFQWFNLTNAYSVYGRLPEAEHAARSTIRIAADDDLILPLTYMLLAGSLSMQDRPGEALQVLDEAAERGIKSLFTEFERSTALLKLGRLDEALAAIECSMEFAWPKHSTGDFTVFSYKRHLVRGQILADMGRIDEALEMFDYALGVDAENPNAFYLKAATLASIGQLDEALPLYEKAATDPTLRAMALQGLGRCLSHTKRHQEAAEAFEEAWKLSPKNYEAWSAWASACEAAQDLEMIVRAYSGFAEENEPSAEILVNWGRALDRAGQHQRALDCFSQALQKNPLDANAYFNCGDLLYRFGHYQDAAFLFESGLRLNPDHANGWLVLGNSLAQLGFVDVARTSYERALVINPDYEEAKHNLEILSEPAVA